MAIIRQHFKRMRTITSRPKFRILLVRASPKASPESRGEKETTSQWEEHQITLERGVHIGRREIIAVSFANSVSQARKGGLVSPEASGSQQRRKWQSIIAADFSMNLLATGQLCFP